MFKYDGIPFNKFISLILAFSNSIKVANQTQKSSRQLPSFPLQKTTPPSGFFIQSI
jgi:hypothetical protein